MVYYIAVQSGLYLFSITHILEYWRLTTSRTHFGDTPVLSFLLLSIGMFLGRGGVEYVYLQSVLLAVPLRVALSTLMLLAHADFANHATTRLEDPAFNKCSQVGTLLSALFLCFVEAECAFAAHAFFSIVAALWVMYLDVTAPPALASVGDLVGMLLALPLAVATAASLYARTWLVMALGVGALFFFGVAGRLLLDGRSYGPTPLLATYWVWNVAHAWDPAADAVAGAGRAAAWAVVFGLSMWGTSRWTR